MNKKIDGGIIVGYTAFDIEEKKIAENKAVTEETVNVSTVKETPVKSANKPSKRARK